MTEVFTFCPVSVVIAKPLGTSPAVLCFFTSRTETTGMATYTGGKNDTKTTFIRKTLEREEVSSKADNEEIIGEMKHQCDFTERCARKKKSQGGERE